MQNNMRLELLVQRLVMLLRRFRLKVSTSSVQYINTRNAEACFSFGYGRPLLHDMTNALDVLSLTDKVSAAEMLLEITRYFTPEANDFFVSVIEHICKKTYLKELVPYLAVQDDGYYLIACCLFLRQHGDDENLQQLLRACDLVSMDLGTDVSVWDERIADTLFGRAWFALYGGDILTQADMVSIILTERPPIPGVRAAAPLVVELPRCVS